ncbi:hypothetical protein TWF281_004814 [Arthrobotrys megalospora]
MGANLDRKYDNLVHRIKGQDRDDRILAEMALLWVAHAIRPLTVPELIDVVGVAVQFSGLGVEKFPTIEEIVASATGVIVADGNDMVRFIDDSAEKYFKIHLPDISVYVRQDPISSIASLCLAYLSSVEFDGDFDDSLSDMTTQHPFFTYAAWHWTNHVKDRQGETSNLALKFLRNDSKASQVGWTLFGHRKLAFGGIHLVAYSGLSYLMEELLEEIDPNTRDEDGRTALFYAAECDHLDIVDLLLRHGADANLEDKDGASPLSKAAENGYHDTEELLLEHGAHHNRKYLYYKALDRGDTSRAIALLMGNGARLPDGSWSSKQGRWPSMAERSLGSLQSINEEETEFAEGPSYQYVDIGEVVRPTPGRFEDSLPDESGPRPRPFKRDSEVGKVLYLHSSFLPANSQRSVKLMSSIAETASPPGSEAG